MATNTDNWIVLDGAGTSFILEVVEQGISVVYWGERLIGCSPDEIKPLLRRPNGPASPAVEIPLTLCPTQGAGFLGSPGISLTNGQVGWDINPCQLETIDRSDTSVVIKVVDPVHKIGLSYNIAVDPSSDILVMRTTVSNLGAETVALGWCAAMTLPLASGLDQLTTFTGRWAGEFQLQIIDQYTGSYVRENRRGRTSHDNFPGLLAHPKDTDETSGEVFGFHLGWSGNHRTVAEKLPDGRALVQMGECLLPGEIILAGGETYQTPALYAAHSTRGFSGMSQKFHHYVRNHLQSEAAKGKPRPVHYNTWEGVYFDHDADKLKALANRVADLGVERFVLDDGWFKGRRDDTAGLGDWYVDDDIYPDGLTSLIDQVSSQGMEFGLWVEPEMVNPDSDLFRRHPEWVLAASTSDQILCRNQLVLDLSKPEVTNYLFERLDNLLSDYAISYLKWDMNRDIHHPGPGNHYGRPVAHAQVAALYELLGKLRARHPEVEIESCASGGGRADYGILSYTDRIWTSDSNDALDRLVIQRGCSLFFPSGVMGAHIGPRVCHITGRTLSAELRAATAMFGHMGVELDPGELTRAETATIKAAIALHKRHRDLIHSGDLVRLSTSGYASAFAIISAARDEAIVSYTQTATRLETVPEVLKFSALVPTASYQLDLVWPTSVPEQTHSSGASIGANSAVIL